MKKIKIIGIIASVFALVGVGMAANYWILPDRSDSLHKDLKLIEKDMDFYQSQIDTFTTKKSEKKNQYNDKLCELAAYKLSEGIEIQQETYSLCIKKWSPPQEQKLQEVLGKVEANQ